MDVMDAVNHKVVPETEWAETPGSKHTDTAASRHSKLARRPVTKHEYFLAAREILKAASPETI